MDALSLGLLIVAITVLGTAIGYQAGRDDERVSQWRRKIRGEGWGN